VELIFEFLIELILEGSIYLSTNKKVPKIIRYLLIFIIVSFFLFTISIIIFLGIILLKINVIVGIFIIVVGLILFITIIIKFKKTYLNKKSKSNL